MPANSNPVPPVFNLPFVAPGSGFLTPQALQFLQLLWSGPAGTSGVFGPPTSAVGDVALWANATGTLLSDGGAASDFVYDQNLLQIQPGAGITITPGGGNTLIIASSASGGDVTGPSSVIADGNFALFNGTTGKIIKDGGLGPGNLAYLNTITASLVTNFFATVLADVTAILVPGLNITITPSGSTLIVSASGATPADYVGAYENNIRTTNGAATNVANLNNLIAALSAGGGGSTIWFNPTGGYPINGTIHLLSNVGIMMAPGAFFNWQGSTSGVIFDTPATDVMYGCDFDIWVNEGAGFTGTVFNMHSCMNNRMKLTGLGTHASGGVFCSFFADSSAGLSPYPGLAANRNFAYNEISPRHLGVCGYGMIMSGIPVGYVGQPQGATLNSFYATQFNNILNRGIKINTFSDSNTFAGNTYIGASSAANSIGLMINEAHDLTASVYNTHFQHLAVDTFGSGLNRTAVVLNESRGMTCSEFFNVPNAENGTFVDGGCLSYLWTEQLASNALYQHQKNFSVGP